MHIQCNVVVKSMIAFSADTLLLIEKGCYIYDAFKGWQTEIPCPSHVICSKIPNVLELMQHRDSSFCPMDFHYRFPKELSVHAPAEFNPLLPYAMKQWETKKHADILLGVNSDIL